MHMLQSAGQSPKRRAAFFVRLLLPLLALWPCFARASSQLKQILPPALPWHGKSEELIASEDDPWITPAEEMHLRDSPDYDLTHDWLVQLVDAAPQLKLVSLGKSYEQRDIWMVIASKEGVCTPEALEANGRPTLLAQAGIHSGEIDGKDAGLMLLRDMTVDARCPELLDGANFLFIPILSVDAHERRSTTNRINQRGPRTQGWRSNARNLNLNRDYTKLDTPETRAVVKALNRWPVDLYLDIHVTDGADYQYDITYGFNGSFAWSPSIGGWLESTFRPALDHELKAMGHVPGDLIFAANGKDMRGGVYSFTAGPRFSTGYGDARHLPTVLVENHSLKDYRRRVLGTRVFLEGTLRLLAKEGESLRDSTARDRIRRRKEIPSEFEVPETKPELVDFLGVKSRRVFSEISGDSVVQWLGEPETIRIPRIVANQPAGMLTRPKAYWIPAAWPEVIERLKLHGIKVEKVGEPEGQSAQLEFYRLQDPKLAKEPYEGHARVSAEIEPVQRSVNFAMGSARVPTDQPLGDLAMLLLEPQSPDSFFQWGFFLSSLQRTEYFESYVMEPMARAMLAENDSLRVQFEQKLKNDEDFAKDPNARLEWFYEKTPYFDKRYRIYPVGIER